MWGICCSRTFLLQVVYVDVLRHTAGVALPGAEVAEDAVIVNFVPSALNVASPPWSRASGSGSRRQWRRYKGAWSTRWENRGGREIERACCRGSTPSPRCECPSVVERPRAALVEGELPGLAAIGGHYVHVEVSVVLAGKGDPLAVRRELGKQFPPRISGDAGGSSARGRTSQRLPS